MTTIHDRLRDLGSAQARKASARLGFAGGDLEAVVDGATRQ